MMKVISRELVLFRFFRNAAYVQTLASLSLILMLLITANPARAEQRPAGDKKIISKKQMHALKESVTYSLAREEMHRSIVIFLIKGFIVCIVFSAVVLLVLRILKIKPPKALYISLIILLLTWDNIYVSITQNYYCWKEGGEKIKTVIENAGGFYETNNTWGCTGVCEERLRTGKYSYIEANVLAADTRSLVEKPGLYRFYLAPKGSPLCKAYYKKYIDDENELCIASEKIKILKSKYSYESYRNENIAPFILKATSSVTDMRTGKQIGTATTFMQYAGWVHYLYHGPTLGSHCPDTSIHYKVLYDTLRVKKAAAESN